MKLSDLFHGRPRRQAEGGVGTLPGVAHILSSTPLYRVPDDPRRAVIDRPNTRLPHAHRPRGEHMTAVALEAQMVAQVETVGRSGGLDDSAYRLVDQQLSAVLDQQCARVCDEFEIADDRLHDGLAEQTSAMVATQRAHEELQRELAGIIASRRRHRNELLGREPRQPGPGIG